jgi:hypothetical protein
VHSSAASQRPWLTQCRQFLELLPPFYNVRLFSIVHIHIDFNKSKYICVSRFINIYINMCNARKSYIMKRWK